MAGKKQSTRAQISYDTIYHAHFNIEVKLCPEWPWAGNGVYIFYVGENFSDIIALYKRKEETNVK